MSKKTTSAGAIKARKEPETEKEVAATEKESTETPKAEKAPKAKKEKAPKAPKEPKPKKEKPVRTTPAHMAKVDKMASKLPQLSGDAAEVFETARKLESGELNILAAHLQLEARRRATSAASTTKIEPGDRVRIDSGTDTRFHGKEGVVTRCNRIRIFVRVPNFEKEAYLFASNVTVLEHAKIDVSDDAPDADEAKAANA